MKALILNSGTGSRMGAFTQSTCKCLVEIAPGCTIFDLQMKFLLEAGITEFCVTTGPFAEKLEHYARSRYPNAQFSFVYNPLYNQTNYIYSIHLANDYLQDDILLLHGDLVFERSVLYDVLASPHSVMTTDQSKPLPLKDFKAVVAGGKVRRVSVKDFGTDARYAQPLYKLQKQDWFVWLDEINRYCENGTTNVYAENALNEISHTVNIKPLEMGGRICFEIDNAEDLAYGRGIYKQLEKQQIHEGFGSFACVSGIVSAAANIFVVCDAGLQEAASALPFNKIIFSDFTPNPTSEEVAKGLALFEKAQCDCIISLGGGSAIDVGKCINIVDNNTNLLDQVRCCHIAIPTTAGTGSEATHFAVVYKNGEKQSIEHPGILPQHVILDPSFLATLPLYHKKSALLDALCQAIESMWAKGATNESRAYAKRAIPLILQYAEPYLAGDTKSSRQVLQAANLAGRAINISKTTAPHAMSYKLSAVFGVAHGHAVALCMPYVWRHLIEQNLTVLDDISAAMGAETREGTLAVFETLVAKLDLSMTLKGDVDIAGLSDSVNPERLGNHPVEIGREALVGMYGEFVKGYVCR